MKGRLVLLRVISWFVSFAAASVNDPRETSSQLRSLLIVSLRLRAYRVSTVEVVTR